MKIPPSRSRLPRSFYDRPTEHVARSLLGKTLIRRIAGKSIGGLIVETEAYLPQDDMASHSARGETQSNSAMFGRAGTLYVYPIHAKYCMNIVTDAIGKGSAVLIRAIEPAWGIPQMMQYRGTDQLRKLARGPAMLCQAMGIDRSFDKSDLLSNRGVWIAEGLAKGSTITATPRIGISSSAELPLRFFIDGNLFVSGRAGDHRTRPSHRLVST